jgi:transcription antitermination factor NusG
MKKWYAIYTKPRWEKKVNTILSQKGIESWCPIQRIERQWSDRKKIVEEPLFKSYVFVRISEAEKNEVIITGGVLNFVHYEKNCRFKRTKRAHKSKSNTWCFYEQ